MTPFARLCLAAGIAVTGIASALHVPQPGSAHAHSYVVQANDTLSAIALRFHVGLGELMRLNGIADPDRVRAGEVLSVGAGGYGWSDPDRADGSSRSWTRSTVPAPGTGSSTGYSVPTLQTDASTNDGASSLGIGTSTDGAASTLSTAANAGYIVARGDTLGGISARFGVSMTSLAAANGLSRPDLLRAGQRLVIPARSLRTVSGLPVASFTGTTAPTAVATVAPATTGIAPATSAVSQGGVAALLTSEAQAYGVDPALVKAVAWQESGWQMVTARDGGIGVMQLMPATAAWAGPALLGRTIDPYNLTDNIQTGVALLASYLRQYGSDVRLALAAYNEGPQNVARGIVSSTAQYIANVLSLQAGFAQSSAG